MGKLFDLRPHQEKAMDLLRQSLRGGKRRPVIQMPTAAGKTILAAHVVDGALKKRNRVAFCVPAVSLIDQTFERFAENGIDPSDMGVVQGNNPWRRPNAPVQICSVQTLATRGFPEVQFVVVDECHMKYDTISRWLAEDKSKIFVGLSATPWSKGMGNEWDDLIVPTSIKELTEVGTLCPIRAFAPSTPDLKDVKTVAGDYHNGQLSEKMSGASIVGDVIGTWVEKARGLQTLVFAVDRGHAEALHKGFSHVGVNSAYIDGNTDRDERLAITRRFQDRDVDVIVSIGTMTTGVDLDVECISFCRPTKSEILWIQAIGRGLRNPRPEEGKKLLLLDHSGTALRLGLPADIHHDRLRVSNAKGEDVTEARPGEKEAAKPRECFQCKAVMPPRERKCPECGWQFTPKDRVHVEEGELVEIGLERKLQRRTNGELSWSEKARFMGELRGYVQEMNYKEGWAANKYKSRTGVWPNDPRVRDAPPMICSMATRSWIRSSQIRWIKGQQKRNRRSDDEIIADSVSRLTNG